MSLLTHHRLIGQAVDAPTLVNKASAVFRTNSGSLSPAYPASIVAGNMIIMVCFSRGGNVTTGNVTSGPSGFTFIGYTYGANANYTAITVYSKVASGSETGTQSFSINTGAGYSAGGQMFQFTPCIVNDWVPALAAGTTSVTMPPISGTSRSLIVNFCTINADNGFPGTWTGVSGGTITPEGTTAHTTSGIGLSMWMSLGTANGSLTGTAVAPSGAPQILTASIKLSV